MLKIDMDKHITKLIMDFEAQTGLRVCNLNLETQQEMGRRIRVYRVKSAVIFP
jgi:hypothetical protein